MYTFLCVEKMTLRTANYVASEQSPISPDTFAAIASWELYARKLTSPLFINPIIAGFYPDSGEVFLSTLDMAGCETRKTDFVAGGSAQNMIMGIGESFWQPGLSPEQLFEVMTHIETLVVWLLARWTLHLEDGGLSPSHVIKFSVVC